MSVDKLTAMYTVFYDIWNIVLLTYLYFIIAIFFCITYVPM